MNKVFKKVFNAARGMMMVVNETTSSVQTGKKAAVTVALVSGLMAGTVDAAITESTAIDSANNTVSELVKVPVESTNRYSLIDTSAGAVTVDVADGVVLNAQGTQEGLTGVDRVYGITTQKGNALVVNGNTAMELTATTAQIRAIRANNGDLTLNGDVDVKVDTGSGWGVIAEAWSGSTVTVDGNLSGTIESAGGRIIAITNADSGNAAVNVTGDLTLKLTNITNGAGGWWGTGAIQGILATESQTSIGGDLTIEAVGTLVRGICLESNPTESTSRTHETELDIGGNVNIDVSGTDGAHAIFSSGTPGGVTIKGDAMLTVKSSASWGTGVYTAYAGDVIIDGATTIDVVAKGAAAGVRVERGNGGSQGYYYAGNAVFNSSLTVTAQSTEGDAYGVCNSVDGEIHNAEDGQLIVKGDAALTAVSDKGKAYGILSEGLGTVVAEGNVSLTTEALSDTAGVRVVTSQVALGGEGKTVSIDSTSSDSYAHGIQVRNKYDGPSSVTVDGALLSVKAEGQYGYGLTVQGMTTSQIKPMSTLTVDSDSTRIQASDVGIFASGDALVDINSIGTVEIDAPAVVEARNGAVVNIKKAAKTVLNGNVVFSKAYNTDSANSAQVNLALTGADSAWNGNAMISWVSGVTATADDFAKAKLNLSLANGAQWTPTVIENVGELEAATFRMTRNTPAGGQMGMDIGKLTLDGGVINLQDGVQVGINELDGSGQLKIGVGEDGKTGAGLNVGQVGEGSALDVTLMNGDLTQELTSDDITADQAAAILGAVDGVETTATIKEGFENGEINVGADGTTKVTANTLMTNALDLATAAPLAINRLLMNDVRKRLGDLRSAEGTHGVWARYDGGRLSGAMGLENDFHTLQAGIDTVPTADAARFGVALSYTKSDADMKRGGAEMDAFGLAVYGMKFFDNGLFVDVIGRLAKADTDLTIDGKVKGSMDNLAVSLSGEAGWRFNMTERHYVEPQVEVTYTRVDNGSLQLDNGTTYEFDSVDSVIGRAGFAAGFTCPNKMGDVYVRASVVREFMGDAGIAVRNGKPIEVNGSDTWFEYGIGANFNVNKNTYVYADIERTSGAALDEDWRANVGVRYSF